MTVLSTNDDVNEIKQLKVAYLKYYKTVYRCMRQHVYTHPAQQWLPILENMLSKVFKNRGQTAGYLYSLFSHVHGAVPNTRLSDSYRSRLKTECSSGAHVS